MSAAKKVRHTWDRVSPSWEIEEKAVKLDFGFYCISRSWTYQIGDAHVFWRSDGSGQVQLDESVGQIAAIGQSTYWDEGPRRQKLLDQAVLAGDACQHHPAGEETPAESVQAVVQGALDVRIFVRRNVVKRYREHGNSANDRS